MDQQRGIMSAGGVYYSEIWPGFAMDTNAVSCNLDPTEMERRSNNSPADVSIRKRRRRNDWSKGGASTSNDNRFQNEGEIRPKVEGLSENTENKVSGEEGNAGKVTEQLPKQEEQPKQDYIHVRARRGQATDSHSLAERARREKISERMKVLQDLVPGCNKVIGKALVLDEIINYIQSLQHQVEFLSMKLEAVNTRVGMEGYSSKEFPQQSFDVSGMQYGSQARTSSPEWLHMQIGGGFERTS